MTAISQLTVRDEKNYSCSYKFYYQAVQNYFLSVNSCSLKVLDWLYMSVRKKNIPNAWVPPHLCWTWHLWEKLSVSWWWHTNFSHGSLCRTQFNCEEQWTKALKFMLTNLKWCLSWIQAQGAKGVSANWCSVMPPHSSVFSCSSLRGHPSFKSSQVKILCWFLMGQLNYLLKAQFKEHMKIMSDLLHSSNQIILENNP